MRSHSKPTASANLNPDSRPFVTRDGAKVERLRAATELFDQGCTLVPFTSHLETRYDWIDNAGKHPCWWPNRLSGDRRPLVRSITELNPWLEIGSRNKDGQLGGSSPFINLAVMGLAQVDADDDASIEWAREYGVTSDDNVWIVKTRRAWRALYRDPEDDRLRLTTKAFGFKLDLLVNSPALVPPSIHPSGFHYQWAPGHSPTEIRFDQLSLPPVLVREKWAEIHRPKMTARSSAPLAQPRDLAASVEQEVERRSRTGLTAPNRDGERKASCPFPENHSGGDAHPSFWLNGPKEVYLCRSSCGGGSYKELADKFGLLVPTVDRRSASRIMWGPGQ